MKKSPFALVALLTFDVVSCALAATVTTLADNGPGSLRAAISTGGNVEFAVTGTILLTSGELVIASPATIIGPGAAQLTVQRSTASGTPEFRVFRVAGVIATISGLTISNRLVAGTDDNGAGILNEGSLTLNDCVVRANRSTVTYARGTGLFNANDATLTANRCVFADNVGTGEYAEGGGIYVFGDVTLNDCTIRDNRGGGIYSRGGGMHVDYFGTGHVARCTFSANSVAGVNAQGGGIYNFGKLDIVNSTLSGNSSGGTGGGLHVDALSLGTTVRNCTISGNTAVEGSGIYNNGFLPYDAGQINISDSIVAGNLSAAEDVDNGGVITSGGHNLFGVVAGNAITAGAGDQFGLGSAALRLAALASNGGPTQTRGLMAGSPGIDAGNPTSVPATDQRGVPRPFGPRPDIGAFELDVILPPVVTVRASRTNTLEGGPTVDPAPGEFTISRTGSTNEPLQIFFRLSGTASNGLDYHFLPDSLSNSVTIPAGQLSKELLVMGLFDGLVEGTETVVLHLEEPACPTIYPPPPGCYTVGVPSEAVVKILDYELPINFPPTIVTVLATQSNTLEAGPTVFVAPGEFTIYRSGSTNESLQVFFRLSGTASNGLDYHSLSNSVTIPAGQTSTELRVLGIFDGLVEGTETVVLHLETPVCLAIYPPPPGCYSVGTPAEAVVRIHDFEHPTNHPPPVSIITPTNHQSFAAPADIWITARMQDTDGFTTSVEFFEGTNSLGLGFIPPSFCGEPACPMIALLTWSNVPPGNYVLTARATDNDGAVGVSEPVHVTVQGLPTLPTVTINATDPTASEPGVPAIVDSGTFTIQRTGSTNSELPVFYTIGGTASNGVDYIALPNQMALIPAGAVSTTIHVVALDDNLVEGNETVELQLFHPPIGAPVDWYVVGTPSNAVVTILDNDLPPQPLSVSIISPVDGTSFFAPADILITASTFDLNTQETVEAVEFFAGTNSLGVVTNYIPSLSPLDIRYYYFGWSNMPAGIYSLTVKSTETGGMTTTSSPVHITVFGGFAPPPTVSIAKPWDGQMFLSPTNIAIVADTVDANGYVWKVEFFADSNKIGEEARNYFVAPPPGEHAWYSFVWTNLSPGGHILTVRATDDQGTTAVSEPVTIWVVTSQPPPLPVVTIRAADPVASEGTNCWQWPGSWNISGDYPGTNTATFVVRRTDHTNGALRVFYRVSGTASNGVDYATLPGEVLIPAGRWSAEFKVAPFDDNIPERIETVTVALSAPLPTMSSAPPYIVGLPRRAAAIVVDDDQPRPVTGRLPDRCFHIMTPGTNGEWFRIESSPDLVNWTPLCTNMVTDGALHFVDPEAGESPQRFYRAMPEPVPGGLLP